MDVARERLYAVSEIRYHDTGYGRAALGLPALRRTRPNGNTRLDAAPHGRRWRSGTRDDGMAAGSGRNSPFGVPCVLSIPFRVLLWIAGVLTPDGPAVRDRTARLALIAGAAVVGPIADETVSAADTDPAPQQAGRIAAAQGFDRTEFELLVYPNGSTRWTFRYKRTLSNGTERRQFERYAERFDGEKARLYVRFVDQVRALTRLGSEATAREMEARAFERNTSVSGLGNQGTVEMSFLWTNFAVVDGEHVVIGDLFNGGPFKGRLYLGPNQQLVIRSAESLAFESVEPRPNSYSGESIEGSDSISWQGERELDNEHPSVVFVPASGGERLLPLTVGGIVLLLLGVAAAVAWRFGATPGTESEPEARSSPESASRPGAEPQYRPAPGHAPTVGPTLSSRPNRPSPRRICSPTGTAPSSCSKKTDGCAR